MDDDISDVGGESFDNVFDSIPSSSTVVGNATSVAAPATAPVVKCNCSDSECASVTAGQHSTQQYAISGETSIASSTTNNHQHQSRSNTPVFNSNRGGKQKILPIATGRLSQNLSRS